MSWTSTPASISSAAMRCVVGLVFSYMNRPVSVTSADVERARDLRASSPRRGSFASSKRISAVHEASVSTRFTVPKRVLSWWWSMFRILALVAVQEVDRHAVDVAAVEEDQHAVDDVGRRLVEDLLEGQEPVLDRQRELLGGEEHDRVLAELVRM